MLRVGKYTVPPCEARLINASLQENHISCKLTGQLFGNCCRPPPYSPSPLQGFRQVLTVHFTYRYLVLADGDLVAFYLVEPANGHQIRTVYANKL